MPDQAVARAIEAARIRAVYDQMPITLVTPLIVAALAGVVLFGVVDHRALLAWAAALVVVTALRFGLWLAHRRQPGRDGEFWRNATLAGSAAAGLAWGGAAGLLFPQAQIYQLFIAFVIGGLCAGSVTTNSSHMPSVLAFVWPATLPLAARFLLEDSSLGIASGGMTLVFAGALSLIASKFHRFFGEFFGLQLALQERTRALSAANVRLQAEIAEHQATGASLRQAQKVEAIGRLTAGIAHDFNNVLTAILGALELLTKALSDPNLVRLATMASQAAERGASLTAQLLTFARKREVAVKPVDVNDILRGMHDMLRRTVAPLARIGFDLEPGLWPATADAAQLQASLLNLAVNARDAMPFGGALSFRTRCLPASSAEGRPSDLRPGDYVVISVSDTGCGMTEETRQRAFDPFFTTKAEGHGTGLGLSMVRGFASQAGGGVAIESAPGRGTTVSIFLPRSRQEPLPLPRDTPDAASPGPIAGLRVLVVDDDEGVRTLIKEILEAAGNQVAVAANGAQGLELLRAAAGFDLLLVDFLMPDMNGGQFATEARGIRPQVPVLLMSGYVESEMQRDLSELGCRRLNKPFRGAELIAAIREVAQESARKRPHPAMS